MAGVLRMKPIQVTLVTGFLGAGKTTLLNRILKSETGLRIAIIENEFGDLGVDGSLLNSACETVFELNDGCVCCTVREDLVEVFKELLVRSDEFDHVIVETTGLAEPAPVLRVFEMPELREAFELDGVVTVVDAGHIEKSLSEISTCAEQISYADLVILNKVDCLSPSALESVEGHLRGINPVASIVRAEHARVDVQSLLTLGGRPEGVEASDESAHVHHSHHHHAIQSVFAEVVGEVDVAVLDLWLGKLIRSRDMDLLRMKGILAVPGDPRRFVFNGVRDVIDVRPERPWGDEPRGCRIVFIGRGLDTEQLRAGLVECRAEAL